MTGRTRGWARGSWVRGGAALLALVAGVQASPALAQLSCDSVYAINGSGAVYTTANNGTQSFVATMPGVTGSVNAFGIGATNRAYVATIGGGTNGGRVTVYSVSGSTATALSNSGTPTLVGSLAGFNSGAVNPANGRFYLAGASINDASATSWELYAFNPATPNAAPVRVAQITGTSGNNGDIAFDSAGNLYMLSGNVGNANPSSRIYRVGQVPTSGFSTLSATVIANVPPGSTGNVGGIAFNATGGLVTSMQGDLIRVFNPLTGALISSSTASQGAVSDLASCISANTISLRKDLPGGRFATGDQFTLQVSGGLSGSVTTSGTASGVQAAVVGPLLGGVDGQSFTLNEAASGGAVLANYRRSWQCVDAANGDASVGSGTTFPGTVTIPARTGSSDVVCTITNAVPPRVTIRKISLGGVGAFSFTGTNGITSQTLTTTAAGTAVSGAVQTLTTVGASTTITESAPPAGYTLTAASCTGLPSGGTATANLGARTLTLNAAATAVGANLTCTFTNTRATSLTLIKTVTNDDGGTQPASAWTLTATGPTTISGATGSAAVTNASVNPGTYTLSESALPAGYSATPYICAINGGVPTSGNSITLATGDSAVCRIHNDDTGAPGQAAACGISSHTGANGASFAFGPGGVNASASLQNITFDAGSMAGGSINRFVDSTGRLYSTPAGPGRWLLTNSNTTTRLTVTFSPAIPAHRIGLAIYDIGTWNNTMPDNSEDPTYNPSLTLSLSGGATSSQFVAHRAGSLLALARFTPASGVVTMDNTIYQPGVESTWRQSVFLRGNTNALVSTLTLTATNIKPGDNIGLGLTAIPSCVTVSKVTEGGVGSFNFTTTNLNNWDNTATASPVTLTTTATGTPVGSTRHYYAHPINSNNQGTQPVTLTEAIPAGWILAPAQCTDANSARNGNTGNFGTLAGGVLTIPADRMRFESNITCTFTNTRAATLRLQKALPDGRAAPADQFTLSMAGTGAPAAVTTTGTGSTATGVLTHGTATPGSAYTLSEVAAAGANLTYYASTYSCSNARPGGQTRSGSGTAFDVTPAAGDDLTCTFTNIRRNTDVSIQKTATPNPAASGEQVVFTLVVTNHGPTAASSVTVTDPAVTGLDCTAAGLPPPTCSASPGAACPSPLTAAGLQAGALIPTLPNAGVVTIGLTCRITAVP